MKDIWKNRINNLEKAALIQENFGFILNRKSPISEYLFRQEILKFESTTNPKEGYLITLEDHCFLKTIAFAGILKNKEVVKIKEYEKEKEISISEMISKYGTKYTKINYYKFKI